MLMVEDRLPKFLVILVLILLAERIVNFFVDRMRRLAAKRTDQHHGAQLRTMASILRATTISFLGFILFLQLLKLIGIDIGPLLSSAAIVGVGIGLAAQSLFKDIINGVFIIIEDQYNVGETVKIASLTGTVEDLTLRLTRLRDGDGTLYIIPNSQVATVSNLSRDFAMASLSISVDASADSTHVLAALGQVAKAVQEMDDLKGAMMGDVGVSGVDSISGRTLNYSVSVKASVARKDDVTKAFRNHVVEIFKREGIPLGIDPANMLLIAQQKAAAPDPTAPPSQQPLVHS
jgi:small conductance mechanosensitive channel